MSNFVTNLHWQFLSQSYALLSVKFANLKMCHDHNSKVFQDTFKSYFQGLSRHFQSIIPRSFKTLSNHNSKAFQGTFKALARSFKTLSKHLQCLLKQILSVSYITVNSPGDQTTIGHVRPPVWDGWTHLANRPAQFHPGERF